MNPRMPAKGSATFTPYAGVLPEGKAETVNAGINLYELVCVGSPTGTQFFGFHDVDTRIKEIQNGIDFGLAYEPRWQRGVGEEREYMKFEYDKTSGRSYALVPDDPSWHNTIRFAELIDSGKFAVSQYFVSGGVISGALKTEELRFIKSQLFDHSVISEGKVLFRSKVLKEALAFEKKKQSEGVKCQTLHSKIPELEQLIRNSKDRDHPDYGVPFNHQEAFTNGIRKDLEEQIKAKFYPETAAPQIADPMAIVSAAFAQLKPEQRLVVFQQQVSAPAAAQASPVPEKKPIDLEKVGTQQIKDLAEDMGIFTQGMQRADMIKAIKEKRAERASPLPVTPLQAEQEFK